VRFVSTGRRVGTGGNEAGHCSSLGRRMHTDHKTTVVWSPVSEPVALSPRRSVARDARPLLERGAQSGAGCGSPGRYPQRTSVASLPGSARVRPRYSSRVRLHGRRSRRVPLPARGTLLRCTSPADVRLLGRAIGNGAATARLLGGPRRGAAGRRQRHRFRSRAVAVRTAADAPAARPERA
jgi:hypothetical protein